MSLQSRNIHRSEENGKSLLRGTALEIVPQSTQTETPESRSQSRSLTLRYVPSIRDLASNKWYGQVLAIIFSLCCSAAIATILSVHDRHPVPKLSGGITLNAIISILATAAKGALLFVTASCLGQLKWSWLNTNNYRCLSDLDLFDSASRGPLGAVELICRMRKGPIVLLGALVTLGSLAFDPFLQQVLTFESTTLYHSTDDVVTNQVRLYLLGANSEPVTSAIYAGIWGPGSTIETNCSSGNCTFEPFESIGWCSSCREDTSWTFREECSLKFDPHEFIDASDEIYWGYISNRTCNLTSPTSQSFGVSVSAEASSGESGGGDSPMAVGGIRIHIPYSQTRLVYNLATDSTATNMSLKTAPLGRWAFIDFRVSNWSLEVNNVSLCDIDFCLRNESLAVTSGTAAANILSTSHARRYTRNFTLPHTQNKELLCWDPKDTSPDLFEVDMRSPTLYPFTTVATSPTTFAWCYVSNTSEWAWASRINKILDSRLVRPIIVYPNSYVSGSPATVTYNGTYLGSELDSNSWIIDDYDANDDLTGQSLLVSRRLGADKLMSNIAVSLTRLGETHGNTTTIQGKLGSTATIVTVRWAWLTLPALLVVGTTLLLALTMLTTYHTKTPVWKSSANAMLYHELHHSSEKVSPLGTISDIEKRARATGIRLTQSKETGRLYLKLQ